jgi:hypothetical protein
LPDGAQTGPGRDGSFTVERVIAKTSTADLMSEAERLATAVAASLGALMGVIGELDKREAWRSEGATSLGSWLAQRCGIAESTGRAWAHVAERLDDLPHLSQGIRVGALSFDKVRAVVDLAKPETDASILRQAEECSVRQLHDLARFDRTVTNAQAEADHDFRYLRFNDAQCSLTARMPRTEYAIVHAAITDGARAFPSDGETPYDQRRCDALVALCRPQRRRQRRQSGSGSGDAGGSDGDAASQGADDAEGPGSSSGFFVVAHTDLALLRGGTGVAEIERLGLLSPEAIRRISCDATVALGLDDAFGHTMYEGRSRRFPSDAQRREAQRRDRRCRFPGCSNAIFTNIHHIVHWGDQGPTDLENLVTLCTHHHHRIHERQWQMSGNANGILHFVGPSGREMTSRPSPLWTRRKE